MQKLAVVLALTTLFPGCAAPTSDGRRTVAQAPRQCFSASRVTGFSEAGPDRALVRIGFQETWELELSPGCPDVDWAMKIALAPRGGGNRICTDRPAEILVPGPTGVMQRCLVRRIRQLSPQEAAAAWGQKPK